MENMSFDDKLKFIQSNLSYAAILEQMAEECTELAQASLKLARILRKENPTPASLQMVTDNLVEECNDVSLCMSACNIQPSERNQQYKLNRWVQRIVKAKQYE